MTEVVIRVDVSSLDGRVQTYTKTDSTYVGQVLRRSHVMDTSPLNPKFAPRGVGPWSKRAEMSSRRYMYKVMCVQMLGIDKRAYIWMHNDVYRYVYASIRL